MKKKILKIIGLLLVLALLTFISLPTLLNKAGLHPEYESKKYDFTNKKAVIISTSHSTLNKPGETTGKLTGVFASELTVPYYEFTDSGIEVDLASINGGTIPIDPESFFYVVKTSSDDRYLEDPILKEKVKNSIKIDELDIDNYDLVFIAGGWGAAYDLAQSPVLAIKVSESYYSDKEPIIGGVCHGVLGLVNARNNEGNLLIAGRRMTGVTDKQLSELGIEFTPKHPETELRRAGVTFESKTAFLDVFATHVTVDDQQRFVTGQNQNSGLEMAHTMMGILDKRN